MRRTIGIVVLAVCGVASAGTDQPVPAMPFEAFASSPDVVVQRDKLIGQLRSSDSVATLTTVVLRDANGTYQSGLRIDLQNNVATDAIYLDETQIELATNELAELESGASYRLDDDGSGALWKTQGTARCWQPDPPGRLLCPSYSAGPDGLTLGLAAFGGPHFAFPGRSPTELIKLIDMASRDLDHLNRGGN